MPENPAAESNETTPPRPEASSKRRTLIRRSASTLVLIAVLVLAIWMAERWIFLALFALFAIGALVEYFRIFPDPGFRRFRFHTYGIAVAYLALLFSPIWGFEAAWLPELDGIALAVLAMVLVLARLRSPLEGHRTFNEISAALFGFVYCILLFGFVPRILLLPLANASGEPASILYLFYLVGVTKLSDMGAYIVGSAIGKQKLVPHISPGKTWQGFWGALAFAVVGSYGFFFLMGDQIPVITALHAGILGVLIALVAILGDLAESIMKRSLAVKDSGHIMPGIGGFLDLIDSVIFTAPLFYFYLLLFH